LFDVNKITDESLALLRYQVKMENIEVVKHLDPALPQIKGDKDQIKEVFLNIMLNATQAMKEKGTLTVTTKNEKVTKYGRRAIDVLKFGQDIVTIDLFPFPNVDIVADIIKTPFPDNAVDFIILYTVLEHAPDPFKVIAECRRILKPKGRMICITPFVFPYHGYPEHFYNFSEDGLRYIFRDFSECKVEMNMGPTCALVNLMSEYFAVAFSGKSKFIYTLCKGLALAPIFLFKYLDIFWASSKKGNRIASHLCVLATK